MVIEMWRNGAQRLAIVGPAILISLVWAVRFFVAPFGQSVEREYALVSSAGDVWFLVATLMLAAALVAVIMLRRHRNLGLGPSGCLYAFRSRPMPEFSVR